MKLITTPISKTELKKESPGFSADFVKAVVDIKKEIMVIGGYMHADEEKELLDQGSEQDNLWGINLYPELPDNDFIEFDSMINVRPRLHNFSRDIENKHLREKITTIVSKLVT